jgi:hypothetical protein
MIHLPHWMIVYGTDRNSGKTTLITHMIRRFSRDVPICGIKISPHFHPLGEQAKIMHQTGECVIVREDRHGTGKDSSRMLDAGAGVVFYVQVWDHALEKVMPVILDLIPQGTAVICESGWARQLVMPGLFLVLHRKGNQEIKESAAGLKKLADRWIESDGQGFDFDVEEIQYEGNAWRLSAGR